MTPIAASPIADDLATATEPAPAWRTPASAAFGRESDRPRLGAGACSKCNCPQWEGSGNQCTNCGHAYEAHW